MYKFGEISFDLLAVTDKNRTCDIRALTQEYSGLQDLTQAA
jgi:hypothetical protein